MGLSQHQFSELIGVTYQQVHKYEHGINSVTAGRLYDDALAPILSASGKSRRRPLPNVEKVGQRFSVEILCPYQ
jgi:transcriptional regulator with XRE-family HTH domain